MAGSAQGATLIEMDRTTYDRLGKDGQVKLAHVDGHAVVIQLYDTTEEELTDKELADRTEPRPGVQ